MLYVSIHMKCPELANLREIMVDEGWEVWETWSLRAKRGRFFGFS